MSDSNIQVVDHQFGKNSVRLLHVRREEKQHFIREIEVNTKLTLNNANAYITGDNSTNIATDSQKNTVYILAKKHGVSTIEEFGLKLCSHFLSQYSWVDRARIYIEEKPWRRVQMMGRPHAHAFVEGGEGTHFCHVEKYRSSEPKVSAGIKDLKVMKTTQSAFVNFVRDEYCTLPYMDDRIFCTNVYAKWKYHTTHGLDYQEAWDQVRDVFMEEFAGPPDTGIFSPSVQKTMYDTQKHALAKIPQMSQIYIELPNVHAFEFDLSKFPSLGLENNGEVFQPTDKPSGNIQGLVKRQELAKL